jgi:hypothetical protein
MKYNIVLYGVTDSKAVGALIEHKFKKHLEDKYKLTISSSASGIDLPSIDIQTDINVTLIKQPQSSCLFKDAKQKIYGLGDTIFLYLFTTKQMTPKQEQQTQIFLVVPLLQKKERKTTQKISVCVK